MSSGNSSDTLSFGLSNSSGGQSATTAPAAMELSVSAESGASGGSYNPDLEEEDKSFGKRIPVPRSASNAPVIRSIRPQTPRRDNLKRSISANARFKNRLDEEALERSNADLERKLKLAMDQDQHLAQRNQENNNMRDNVEDELQRRLMLSQQQVTHIAQVAQNNRLEAEHSKQQLEAISNAAKYYADRSTVAEATNQQLILYLDRVAAELDSSKQREAITSETINDAQSKFEELCKHGQSLEEQLLQHQQYIISLHRTVNAMRAEYVNIHVYADDSQVMLSKTCEEKLYITMQYEKAASDLRSAADRINHLMTLSRRDKIANSELHQRIGELKTRITQIAAKPSEAHLAEAVARATIHHQLEIGTWQQALNTCSSGMQDRLTIISQQLTYVSSENKVLSSRVKELDSMIEELQADGHSVVAMTLGASGKFATLDKISAASAEVQKALMEADHICSGAGAPKSQAKPPPISEDQEPELQEEEAYEQDGQLVAVKDDQTGQLDLKYQPRAVQVPTWPNLTQLEQWRATMGMYLSQASEFNDNLELSWFAETPHQDRRAVGRRWFSSHGVSRQADGPTSFEDSPQLNVTKFITRGAKNVPPTTINGRQICRMIYDFFKTEDHMSTVHGYCDLSDLEWLGDDPVEMQEF
jgi:hypothetical protein